MFSIHLQGDKGATKLEANDHLYIFIKNDEINILGGEPIATFDYKEPGVLTFTLLVEHIRAEIRRTDDVVEFAERLVPIEFRSGADVTINRQTIEVREGVILNFDANSLDNCTLPPTERLRAPQHGGALTYSEPDTNEPELPEEPTVQKAVQPTLVPAERTVGPMGSEEDMQRDALPYDDEKQAIRIAVESLQTSEGVIAYEGLLEIVRLRFPKIANRLGAYYLKAFRKELMQESARAWEIMSYFSGGMRQEFEALRAQVTEKLAEIDAVRTLFDEERTTTKKEIDEQWVLWKKARAQVMRDHKRAEREQRLLPRINFAVLLVASASLCLFPRACVQEPSSDITIEELDLRIAQEIEKRLEAQPNDSSPTPEVVLVVRQPAKNAIINGANPEVIADDGALPAEPEVIEDPEIEPDTGIELADIEPLEEAHPISPAYLQIKCESDSCSFWATQNGSIYAYRATPVREGACEIGPCIVDLSGKLVPDTCLGRSTNDCPEIEMIAKIR